MFVRGQLDPVFSFKDKHKANKTSNIICADTEIQFQWAMQNIGVLENYTKSNNIKKLLTEL